MINLFNANKWQNQKIIKRLYSYYEPPKTKKTLKINYIFYFFIIIIYIFRKKNANFLQTTIFE